MSSIVRIAILAIPPTVMISSALFLSAVIFGLITVGWWQVMLIGTVFFYSIAATIAVIERQRRS
jgi:hypothetical protein